MLWLTVLLHIAASYLSARTQHSSADLRSRFTKAFNCHVLVIILCNHSLDVGSFFSRTLYVLCCCLQLFVKPIVHVLVGHFLCVFLVTVFLCGLAVYTIVFAGQVCVLSYHCHICNHCVIALLWRFIRFQSMPSHYKISVHYCAACRVPVLSWLLYCRSLQWTGLVNLCLLTLLSSWVVDSA